MNRYVKLGLFLAFICPAAVYAAEDPLKFKKGEENFKMDTSFPVPYVAYDDINVRKELQLGLKDNAEISVGALDVQDKAVASVAASKTLSLQNIGNVTDTSFINLGNSSGTTATAKFADVTVNTISTKNSSVDVNIATVDNINAKTAMKLYPGKVKNPNLPTGCQKGWAWVPFALEGDDCNNQKYYLDYPQENDVMYCQINVDNLLSGDDSDKIMKLENEKFHIEISLVEEKTIINIHKLLNF